jgi:hypothetical protein
MYLLEQSKGFIMSDPSASGPSKPGLSKKPISPARKIIGAVALVALVGVAWLEYSALLGYNSAVRALQARSEDESKDLMTVQEAETLMGKSPDRPGTDFEDVVQTFMKIPQTLTKKEYTWRGVFKSHTLTAYYTKSRNATLHHFETEGAQVESEPAPQGPSHVNEEALDQPGSKAGAATTPTAAAPAVASKEAPGTATKEAAPVPATKGAPVPAKTSN